MIVDKDEGSVNATNATESGGLKVVDLTKLRPQKIEWLWEGRIPRGCISLLEGDPGLGKTLMSGAIAAAISTGRAVVPGDDPIGPPADVIFLSAEDDVERTILPRLIVAGADLSRIHVVTVVGHGTEERPVVLPDDLHLIEELVIEKKAALVVFDPFSAFLSGKHDAHKDADIRRVLHPIKLMAEKTGAAVLILRHLNKSGEKSAMYRGGGSIGIIAASRAAFVVGRHPGDSDACVVALQKSNLGQQVPSLSYRVVEKEVEVFDKDGNKEVTGVGCLEWIGEVDFTANDILACPQPGSRSPSRMAEEFLKDILANGPMLSKLLEEEAIAKGISQRTLDRAKKIVGVLANQSGQKWYSQLPSASTNHVAAG